MEAISKIEKEYMKLANFIIKDYSFYSYDLKTLSAACVAFLRKVNGFQPIWNTQLAAISGVTEELLSSTL